MNQTSDLYISPWSPSVEDNKRNMVPVEDFYSIIGQLHCLPIGGHRWRNLAPPKRVTNSQWLQHINCQVWSHSLSRLSCCPGPGKTEVINLFIICFHAKIPGNWIVMLFFLWYLGEIVFFVRKTSYLGFPGGSLGKCVDHRGWWLIAAAWDRNWLRQFSARPPLSLPLPFLSLSYFQSKNRIDLKILC